jgi:hypothetical protein
MDRKILNYISNGIFGMLELSDSKKTISFNAETKGGILGIVLLYPTLKTDNCQF